MYVSRRSLAKEHSNDERWSKEKVGGLFVPLCRWRAYFLDVFLREKHSQWLLCSACRLPRKLRVPSIRLLIPCAILCFSTTAHAVSRYAGDFLAIGVSPRAIGMGSAVTATASGAEAAYWNPAGLATGALGAPVALAFEHAERFGGIVQHDVVSAAVPISRGVLGGYLFRGAIDGIVFADSTTLVDPRLPLSESNMPDPAKTHTFSNADYVAVVAYGKRVLPSLRIGGGLKIIRRTIGGIAAVGYGVDLGAQWDATSGLALGLLVRDATTTRVTWDNNRTDVVQPTLHTGLAYTMAVTRMNARITFAGNSTLGSESGGYGGFAPWRFLDARNVAAVGAEYEWRQTLALRIGSQNLRGMLGPGSAETSVGMGVRGNLPWVSRIQRVGVDVAWMRHTLRDSFRLGTTVEW
jgi:hypothetical protein